MKVKYNSETCSKQAFNVEEIKDKLYEISGMKVEAPPMLEVMKSATKILNVDTTALILGETGVGKEGIAKYIHFNSSRRNKAFITINCGAIPENLIESELFGYEAGAFTGASKGGKIGLFQLADGGTIFLDEVGELPLLTQVKLLRVIQEKKFEKVGGTNSISVDIRIIAATNKDLKQLIKAKEFRSDLYYRLSVFPIKIPPLRERKEDVPLLIQYFMDSLNKKYNLQCYLSEEAMEYLYNYEWPGNVRELKNVIERQIIMAEDNEIKKNSLPEEIIKAKQEQEYMISINNYSIKGYSLKEIIEEIELEIINDAINRHGNIKNASKALGIDASTIVRKRQRIMASNK
ncbi:hypothetical protein GCM10008908_33850 [Clostridium subterminale]|uniref:HTH-type transcriptional regulatory protein TyrR n=1 Tax=Clostridium subterminale TaxID=1550 RepID=A0ABN1KWS0_CLOSU